MASDLQMTDDVAVRARGLTKWYGDARGVVDLDLDVERGEVFGFIGPNGAGKTTTIRLLLDLIRPSYGSASVLGLDCKRDAVEVKRRIGYVPADLQLFDRLTGDELLAWLGRLRGRHDPAWSAELARRLALDTGRRIGDLSTGNRQKVGIVQAFMHRPELLILDEPTSGLDPLVRRSFRDLVNEVVDGGATVFLSSHVLSEVEDICDRVAMIVDGRLRRVDTVADLGSESRRRVRLLVKGPADLESLRALRCVRRADISTERRSRSGRVTVDLDVAGPMDELIKVIGSVEVVDLLSEPVSLEDVFLESYDNGHDTVDPQTGNQTGKEHSHAN